VTTICVVIAWVAFVAHTPHAHAADQPSTAAVATAPAASIHIDGGYAVGTSQATWDDPA